MYDNLLKDYKEKQEVLMDEMSRYHDANESYYLTANRVLSLAQRALEIFESSEVEEKRQLLNFLFQNCQWDRENVLFKMKTPFDTVLHCSESSKWGDRRESNPRSWYHKPVLCH